MINLLSHTHVKKIEEVNIAFWVREKYMCKLLNTIFHLIQGFLGSFSSFSHLNGVFLGGTCEKNIQQIMLLAIMTCHLTQKLLMLTMTKLHEPQLSSFQSSPVGSFNSWKLYPIFTHSFSSCFSYPLFNFSIFYLSIWRVFSVYSVEILSIV